ncbi:MAG TPA: glycosyltransferase family 2 protein [Candidatus Paceibacterota bacterium]|nr:glycosyltransferase family 2 protein [Candidatus Paceibacterota bacterium]
MGESVRVSVVIVSWNAKAFLARCLASLTERACAYPMEVIVVDNASQDGSPEMVERDFPQVRLIRTGSNLGFARGNNRGIRESRGKYLCLINSDVEVRPDCITRLVDYCEAHPDVGMVGPRILGGDGKLQRSCRGFPTVWNMLCRALALDAMFPRSSWFGGYLLPYWNHDSEREVDILSGCFWMVRRAALETVGLLDESFFMYGEDMDWCKRFWAGGWRLVFVPDAVAVHYGGASSASAPVRFFIEKQRADLQYWRKHHSWAARQCYFAVACVHHALRVLGYTLAWAASRGRATEWRFKMIRGFQCLSWMLGRGRVPA